MPTAVNVQGTTTRRPGVYSEVDVSAVGGRVLEINHLAVLGEFPVLQKATPSQHFSGESIRDLSPNDQLLAFVGRFAYNPANDARVPGGPTSVRLVSVVPTTQAQLVLLDSGGNDSLTLKATAWGVAGNRTIVSVANNAGDATLRDVTVARDGVTETYAGLGTGPVLEINYTGADATAMAMAYDRASGITIAQGKTGLSPASAFIPTSMAFDGTISITLDAAPGAGETFSVLIAGINKATGLADTETLAWADVDGAPKTTAKAFADVTSFTPTNSGGSAVTAYAITNLAFDLSPANYANAGLAADRINAYSDRGFVATKKSAQAAKIALGDLDDFVAAAILSAAKSLRADTRAIVGALNHSILITATRATAPAGAAPPVALGSSVYLAGGTETTPGDGDWQDAFVALRSEDVQILSLLSTDASVHGLGNAHCAFMAGAGANERNLWVGGAANEALSAVKARTVALNSRHTCYVPQQADVVNAAGETERITPDKLAFILASMQAGTNVGVPLTRKRPNVLAVYDGTDWDADEDVEALLASGAVVLTSYRLGLRVERSITTYQEDDNPIFSEMSANESFNTSIRDLRQNLDLLIGEPALPTTAGRIRTLTKTILERQVLDGIIKAYRDDSVVVEDLGDLFRVRYAVAPIEPTNFIVASATVARIAA